ncbi:M48 family metallopeptidase [Sphingomonas sp.]|jgi:predicted Zn-dependent protease|uniref:M48 family metallopeptidase n=1 Tax=Sphingomonas sp. TaxID=28214 RepID=UPI002EDA9E6C
MRRLIAAALATALLPAPATAETLAPLPPYAAAYQPVTVDERGLWQQADEHERALRDSPAVIRDAALNAYVRGVLCHAVGEDRCRAVRLYIVRVPAFNASMSPNGTMIVWTGLLLRVRNEAELAAILGHEFGHFELRHSLSSFKRARTTTDIMSWASVLAPYNSGSLATSLIGLHFSYGRTQESDADLMGLRYMRAARYRPAAFPRVWERMMAETDASALGRRRKVTHRYSAGFFDSHPTELARAANLRAAAGAEIDTGEEGVDPFLAAMRAWRPQFLADQIKLNDFGGSEYLLGQLADRDWSPDLLFARAELYRERGNPRDLVSAAEFYREAIDRGFDDPIAWRGLGVSLLRAQQAEAGRAALTTYLERAPQATDRAAMSMLIGPGDVK